VTKAFVASLLGGLCIVLLVLLGIHKTKDGDAAFEVGKHLGCNFVSNQFYHDYLRLNT
jgi:hypothetical protein